MTAYTPLPKRPGRIALLFAISGILHGAEGTAPPPKYPPHTIPGSELRVLPARAADRTYQLHILKPASFDSEPGRRYPVMFLTDAYWDFPSIASSVGNLVFDKVLPEILVVGLGYAGDNLNYDDLRLQELSPVKLDVVPPSGGGTEFLRALEEEIIPLVERDYRADPAYRVLAGSSLGGLFTLYTLLAKPDLFRGYIAVSPATDIADDWLFRYEANFAESARRLDARLFISGAEHEWPAFLEAIKRFDRCLEERAYPGLTRRFRLIDGERHAGTKAEGYVRGMRFAFEPLAPETGPSR